MPAEEVCLSDITAIGKRDILPSSVLVEVCYGCNENCVHCCLEEHRTHGMSLAEYGDLFDEMVKAGTFYVILTGGEPFTRRDFLEIVKSARKRRLSVTVFTNGTLLKQSDIDRLRELRVEEVHVSIYSANPAIHDAITRLPGSFQRSLWAIRHMIKAGIKVRIKCPLMKMTADGTAELKALARGLGISVQFSAVITAQNDGSCDTHQCRVSDDQLRQIVADPEILTRGSAPVHHKDNPEGIPCDTIFNGGAIDPEGNVRVCNQWRVIGGNVKKAPLLEIWQESPEFCQMRAIKVRHLQECARCDLFEYCTRCPGLAFLEDGDVLGCSSVAKRVAEERRRADVYPTETHIFSQPRLEGGE